MRQKKLNEKSCRDGILSPTSFQLSAEPGQIIMSLVKKALFVLLVFQATMINAQSSVWYFGTNAGIKFNADGSTSPQSGSALITNEGCSIATDLAGNVLFYTDGKTVYNGGNAIVNTGKLLSGNSSSTQSALIVPLPVSTASCTVRKFVVFTTEGVETVRPAGISTVTLPCYPTVTVTARGLGIAYVEVNLSTPYPYTVTVDTPDFLIPLTSGSGQAFSEKLAATSDGNNGYWVMAHDFQYVAGYSFGNQFHRFHISNNATFQSVNSTASAKAALFAGNPAVIPLGSKHTPPTGSCASYNAQG